ncbi:hypothetical protein B7R25_02815 [Subtercola boreus]|uniref:Uncharacterized protein n=2 Tax=Subtercola boreus TaxID=120213 RepID=A0A3E0WDD2_9MICO|nr:hypothetical protein B7R24_02805 [Subtercola boreus]RFA23179.1 hypothetical protein B7R23_02800 [Subtercola boreus]RFA28930.1 hypothetical protein B7R25_02815 [Subtercola boreus]
MTRFGTYTAKLVDGPLEGKTISTGFSDGGEPQPRMSIPTDSPTKHYLYIRGSGIEFAEGSGATDRPSAIEYRFVQAVFE